MVVKATRILGKIDLVLLTVATLIIDTSACNNNLLGQD